MKPHVIAKNLRGVVLILVKAFMEYRIVDYSARFNLFRRPIQHRQYVD